MLGGRANRELSFPSFSLSFGPSMVLEYGKAVGNRDFLTYPLGWNKLPSRRTTSSLSDEGDGVGREPTNGRGVSAMLHE
jgi:hypothetical protein